MDKKEKEVLEKYILEFLLLLLDYNLKDDKYKSVLINITMVFKINNNYN